MSTSITIQSQSTPRFTKKIDPFNTENIEMLCVELITQTGEEYESKTRVQWFLHQADIAAFRLMIANTLATLDLYMSDKAVDNG